MSNLSALIAEDINERLRREKMNRVAKLASATRSVWSVLALFGALQVVTLQAHAAGTVNAKVIGVRTDNNGFGMIIFDQNVGGSPASCRVSAYANALAFDANTPAGRAILASALASKAAGTVMSASGTGLCGIYGNWVEDLNYSVGS